MNTEKLIDAIGNIREEFIVEAKKKTIKKKSIYIISGLAAVFAVVFFLLPNIPNFMGANESDVFRAGTLIEGITLDELQQYHGGTLLAGNLIGDNSFEFYSKKDVFSSDIDDWYSLLYSEYNNDSKIILHCLFGEQTENWKVDMVFTDEATYTQEFNGIEVLIAKWDQNLNFSYTHYAVFEYDGVVYDLRVSSNSPDTITEVLTKLTK